MPLKLVSHLSIHLAWKGCKQVEITLISLVILNLSKQMEHVGYFSMALLTFLGLETSSMKSNNASAVSKGPSSSFI